MLASAEKVIEQAILKILDVVEDNGIALLFLQFQLMRNGSQFHFVSASVEIAVLFQQLQVFSYVLKHVVLTLLR